jgi:hypothetical protein
VDLIDSGVGEGQQRDTARTARGLVEKPGDEDACLSGAGPGLHHTNRRIQDSLLLR